MMIAYSVRRNEKQFIKLKRSHNALQSTLARFLERRALVCHAGEDSLLGGVGTGHLGVQSLEPRHLARYEYEYECVYVYEYEYEHVYLYEYECEYEYEYEYLY